VAENGSKSFNRARFPWERWRPRRLVRRNRRNAGKIVWAFLTAGPSAQFLQDAGGTPALPGTATGSRVAAQPAGEIHHRVVESRRKAGPLRHDNLTLDPGAHDD